MYGIDLARALWVEQMSLRRLHVLVAGLPASSRTWSEENGGWTVADHLAATTAELTHATFRAVLASIPSKHRRKLPEPLRIPRPGAKPKAMSLGELARAMTRRR